MSDSTAPSSQVDPLADAKAWQAAMEKTMARVAAEYALQSASKANPIPIFAQPRATDFEHLLDRSHRSQERLSRLLQDQN